MATTMAADDNDNKVDGDGAMGNDDGAGGTGDDPPPLPWCEPNTQLKNMCF
jgi:hypothetical protein